MSDTSPRSRSSRPSRAVVKSLFAKSGGQCSFPNCTQVQVGEGGLPLLELAHISSAASLALEDANGESNLIVLCANHHRLVDQATGQYPEAWLRSAKSAHEASIAATFQSATTSALVGPVAPRVRSPLAAAHARWLAEGNDPQPEEHWQQLLAETPACLASMMQGRAYRLASKCYVGGKGWDNRGGNELDFLASHSANLACIEIKTPQASLFGRRYRGNVYLPSDDLVGGCVQVLESRRLLVQSLDLLNARSEPGEQLAAASPPACFLVIGDLRREDMTLEQRTSFDLFRHSLRDVAVYTFDELFGGVAMLLEATSETDESRLHG